jgi:putative flavoprotein involved in K+ transport
MPASEGDYPTKKEVLQYLKTYEERYQFPIERPVKAETVAWDGELFTVFTDQGTYQSRTLVSATGTWTEPYLPEYPNRYMFSGYQVHSAFYQNAASFEGQKVLIVGGGNSGAQILAEVSKVADTKWVTLEEPRFLPDEVDGRYLFNAASQRYRAMQAGKNERPPSLGDIVMVPSVKEARARGVLQSVRPFRAFYENGVEWQDGKKEAFDAVIWCTGFKSALSHLRQLDIFEANGRIRTKGTRSLRLPALWLVGYGGWTGFASATLIGVGRTARQTVKEIGGYLTTGQ